MKSDERVEDFVLTGTLIIKVDDGAGRFDYILERTCVN